MGEDVDVVVRAPLSIGEKKVIFSFVLEILHGDVAHQKWLLQAADDFSTGRRVRKQQV